MIKKCFVFLISFLFLNINLANARNVKVIEKIIEEIRSSKVLNKTERIDKLLVTASKLSKYNKFEKGVILIVSEDRKLISKFSYSDKSGKIFEGIVDYAKLASAEISDLERFEYFIEPELYFSDDIKILKNKLKEIKIISPRNSLLKVIVEQQLVELSPSLYCRIPDQSTLVNILNFDTWHLKKQDFKIASILDPKLDFDTHKALSKIATDNFIDYNVISRDNIEEIFKKSKDKFLFITGHHEDKKIFARDCNYREIISQSFSEQELNELSRKYDVYVLYLGCNTSQINNGAGLLKDIYDSQLVNQLKTAFNKTSFTDFISSLGTTENPLIFYQNLFDKDRILYHLNCKKINERLSLVTISFSSSLRPLGSPKGVNLFVNNMTSYLFWIIGIVFVVSYAFKKWKFLWGIPVVVISYIFVWMICQIIKIF